MNKLSVDPVNIEDAIDQQENELKQLLNRVMASPLEPVIEQITKIDKRLEILEAQCKDIAEFQIPSLNRFTEEKANEARTQIKKLHDDLEDQLSQTLKTLSQDLADQGTVVETAVSHCNVVLADALVRVDEVNGHAKTAAEFSGQAVAALDAGFKATGTAQERQHSQLEEFGTQLVDELQQGIAKSEILARHLTALRDVQDLRHDELIRVHDEQRALGQAQSAVLGQSDATLKEVLIRIDGVNDKVKTAIDRADTVLSTLDTGFKNSGTAQQDHSIKLEQSDVRLSNELHRGADHVGNAVLQVSTRIENLDASFEQRLQKLRKQILVVTAITCLSVAGTITLVAKMLM